MSKPGLASVAKGIVLVQFEASGLSHFSYPRWLALQEDVCFSLKGQINQSSFAC